MNNLRSGRGYTMTEPAEKKKTGDTFRGTITKIDRDISVPQFITIISLYFIHCNIALQNDDLRFV